MIVKYIANDGMEFDNEINCKKYEESLEGFAVEYIDVDGGKREYTGDGKDFDLINFITATYTFKITAGYNNWNEFIGDNFSSLDDDIYYNYEIPIILEEQVNQWLGYTMDKSIETFNHIISEAKKYVQCLEGIKNIL